MSKQKPKLKTTSSPPGRLRELGEEKDKQLRRIISEATYLVSSDGKVTKAANGRVLLQWTSRSGYRMVTLIDKGLRIKASVHRLVALKYLPQPLRYLDVDHNNGVKTDNRAENLAWRTRAENIRLDFDAGRCNIGAKGESHNNAKLSDKEALAVCRLVSGGKLSLVEVAEAFGVSAQCIRRIVFGSDRPLP